MAVEFKQNYQSVREINTTPSAGSGGETWAPLSEGIISAPDTQSDKTQVYDYMSGMGQSETLIMGMNRSINFTGHRAEGDAAQDWIDSIRKQTGDNRKTQYRQYDPVTKKGEQADVTVQINSWFGGNANDRSQIDFTLNFNTIATDITVTP